MVEINNITKNRVNLLKTKKIVNKFLEVYKKKDFNVSIAIVGDKAIKDLNREHRKKDQVTDVLSFERNDFDSDKYLGEVVICFPQIKRQSQESGKRIEDEFIFILIHGLLHLVGYADNTEKNRLEMIKIGDEFIEQFRIKAY